ncbi:hypothetical protein NPIL_121251 [Nephila pilipes]|uniref:Uncharacterized protein n=1 Tax=Nephila pilipes TaxID=299642 RepID=A0A8X6PHE1_NEPPI|nr:hypothetical protein NPIL_121251 [Nephila pilipes]
MIVAVKKLFLSVATMPCEYQLTDYEKGAIQFLHTLEKRCYTANQIKQINRSKEYILDFVSKRPSSYKRKRPKDVQRTSVNGMKEIFQRLHQIRRNLPTR